MFSNSKKRAQITNTVLDKYITDIKELEQKMDKGVG